MSSLEINASDNAASAGMLTATVWQSILTFALRIELASQWWGSMSATLVRMEPLAP